MDLDIVKFPDPVLRRVAKPVPKVDDEVRERARKMVELMYRDKGVGLAAPQVGWSARLFVMNPTGKPEDVRVFVNPAITMRSKATDRSNEGCLSIPEVNGKIERSLKIHIDGLDLEGNEH
ncbi:MAG TPA: peptide deformylase, partial [Planctomycetota bacterium]|nr:peptide deformylase [Planctomycetota bacterium]